MDLERATLIANPTFPKSVHQALNSQDCLKKFGHYKELFGNEKKNLY
jgi:hypothetical protein